MNSPTPDQGSPRASISTGLFKLSLVLRHEAWKAAGEHGLTPTQSQVLGVLATLGDGMAVGAVAEQLAISKGTVSAAVSTLERKGLLTKVADAADGRSVNLKLSKAGRREAKALAPWPEVLVGVIDTLPASEQAGLLRGLMGLIRGLQERGAIPLSRMCVECRFFHPNRYRDTPRPHHCAYLNAPLANIDLRIDCAEMEPAPEGLRPRLLEVLFSGSNEPPSDDDFQP